GSHPQQSANGRQETFDSGFRLNGIARAFMGLGKRGEFFQATYCLLLPLRRKPASLQGIHSLVEVLPQLPRRQQPKKTVTLTRDVLFQCIGLEWVACGRIPVLDQSAEWFNQVAVRLVGSGQLIVEAFGVCVLPTL